ncbi:hypothetical protein [Crenobacter luteus]|uniref:hypothetical protein n=1 Tax=Crenobacter luteus TaxID=1452487 RepID=UPI001E62934B|nr:hypothetical protein [Crenobacter luteus]
MLERLKRLLGWLRCLFVPAAGQPALTRRPGPARPASLPWIVPLCRSWPVPRHGKTGVAAIKRAARKRRNRQRSRQ